jgi:hypothetical protein
MARDNRTLKLSILADIDDLKKKLDQADDTVQKSSSKIGDFSKKAALAFAAAGIAAAGYASKLAIDGVKAAIEDEAAQLRLANALKAATGATDAQVKATEDMILKTSLATGVADDALRPALQRLAVSTKDTVEAQKLLGLALDISKASGKDLESVANALGRAQDGNTTSLGRLGLGLSDVYGGAAAANAETFQGKIDRLKVGFDEAKESLGVALLPQIEKFITFLNDVGIPALNDFIAGLTGDDSLSSALQETGSGFYKFGVYIEAVAGNIKGFITLIREAIGALVEFANQGIRAVNIINPGADIGYIPNPSLTGSMLGQTPSVPTPTALDRNPTGRIVNNITIKAVDSEGAARAVAKVLSQSSARSIPSLDPASIRRLQ